MKDLTNLLDLMAKLRHPATGSPWERNQTFESVAKHTVEEAYEVADAIHKRDLTALKSELGDLLLQVIFHSRMAEEAGAFKFEDVVKALAEKLEQRLPHMYGRAAMPQTAQEQHDLWNALKPPKPVPESVLDTVSPALPPYERMVEAQKAAMKAGWKWDSVQPALEKTREELSEVEEAIAEGDPKHIREEIGDLIFMSTVLCHYLDIEPNDAVISARAKHERRVRHVEKRAKEHGHTLATAPHADERAWYAEIKALEKKAS